MRHFLKSLFLASVVRSLVLPVPFEGVEGDLEKFMKHVDTNEDGQLSLDELFAVLGEHKEELGEHKEAIAEAFEMEDTDKSGGFDMEELQGFLNKFREL
mmetsp:Transcript_25192/g.71009  ORF Transcript_25192/g.71009 Transcript_25192/m.71009 type:complete len:99 (-) Transcript_25192:59-355(-)